MNQSQKRFQKEYAYYTNDDRSPQQILLTTNLCRVLTQLNLQDLKKEPIKISSNKRIKKQDILYVCLTGIPPYLNQFQFIKLPGQVLQVCFASFDKQFTNQELKDLPTSIQYQAQKLHEKINYRSTTKPIVFVYHSFGTFIMAAYNHIYNDQRVIGMIDIGGMPIRFCKAQKQSIFTCEKWSFQQLNDNIDQIFQNLNQSRVKIGASPYQNKFQVLGLVRGLKSEIFKVIFKYIREYPKVLKCFIYGRRDLIFPESLMDEKVAYYCYKQKFDQTYEQNMKNCYKNYFGSKCDNIQQKFVYSIKGGLHSIHQHKRFKQTLAKITERYLSFLEQIHSEHDSKL